MKRLMNDLPLANPGFNWLGKGMVLRLPKMDPRLTRQRKIKRRMKDYVPPEEPEEQIDWWDDPEFEEKMADVFAETALSMGLDENVLRDELGLGEGTPLLKEASSKNWTQSRTEKGNLHSPRTSSGQDTQSQTGESSQATTESTTPPVTLTDEQIDKLREELEKLGLDVDVAMAELGVGEGATASTTASQPTDTGVDGVGETSSGNGKDEDKEGSSSNIPKLDQPEEPTPPEKPKDMVDLLETVESEEELEQWREALANMNLKPEVLHGLEYMAVKKEKELEDESPKNYEELQDWFHEAYKQASTEKEKGVLEKTYLEMRKKLPFKECNLEEDQYCILHNGAFIDNSHVRGNVLASAQDLWAKIKEARGEGPTIIEIGPQTSPFGGNFSVEYQVNIPEMNKEELREVGLGIWLDYQNRFERWQWEKYPIAAASSTYNEEDIPSTYLAFVLGTEASPSYEEVVKELGGGYPSDEKPPGKDWYEDFPKKLADSLACIDGGACWGTSSKNKTHYFKIQADGDPFYRFVSYPEALDIKVGSRDYWEFVNVIDPSEVKYQKWNLMD